MVGIGYPNTEFVASEGLTSPCILSAHVVRKGQREESGVMKMSHLIQKANENDQMSKKWARGGLFAWLYIGKEKSSGFHTTSIEIFHIPNHYYKITSSIYSGLPVLDIPTGVETKLRILLKEDSWLIFLQLFSALNLIPFGLRKITNQTWYLGCRSVPSLLLIILSKFL